MDRYITDLKRQWEFSGDLDSFERYRIAATRAELMTWEELGSVYGPLFKAYYEEYMLAHEGRKIKTSIDIAGGSDWLNITIWELIGSRDDYLRDLRSYLRAKQNPCSILFAFKHSTYTKVDLQNPHGSKILKECVKTLLPSWK